MSYSPEKVAIKPEEHEAAKAADEIYEILRGALEDGAQMTDIAVLPQLIGPTTRLYKWLMAENRAEFASKIMLLGVLVERDNNFL